MGLKFSKFGKIKEATIELDGLSVIAGLNDTGKSTIGKAAYSMIKSIKNFPQWYLEMQQQKAFADLIPIVFELLKSYTAAKDDPLYQQMLKIRSEMFSMDSLFGNANLYRNIEQYLETTEKFIQKNNINDSVSQKLKQIIIDLRKEATDDEKFIGITADVFGKSFKRIYNNSMTKEDAKIDYSVGNNILASIEFKKNQIESGHLNVDYKSMSFRDATLIESPLYLEEGHSSNLPYAKDLKTKIESAKRMFTETDNNTDIIKQIDVILNGAQFNYDTDQREWKYTVSDGADSLHIENIASGSKMLGILYVLLKTGVLTPDSLLILDEPENHLHPDWQIKLAKILVSLVKNDFHILLTTHSPTFIHALMKYSKDILDNKNKVNFYLANKIKDTNYSIINNVNNDINKIFENLTAPNDILYFG